MTSQARLFTARYLRPTLLQPAPTPPRFVLPPPKTTTITATRGLTTPPPTKMRVPYAPSTPPTAASSEIYARIAARRAPRPLIPLDLALLHNPQLADGWNSLIGAVRTQTGVGAGLRELAISRVAVLNGAVHEWDVHARLAVGEGVSRAVLERVMEVGVGGFGGEEPKEEEEGGGEEEPKEGEEGRGDKQPKKGEEGERERERAEAVSEEQAAVLCLTDQMTIGVRVEEAVMERVQAVLGDKGTVEMVATVASYNMVSRFLVALDVGECNARGMKRVEEL